MKRRSTAAAVLGIVLACSLCAALSGCGTVAPSEKEESTSVPAVDDSVLITPGTLTVGLVCQDNAPLAGQNASGEYVGIDADVAAALADEMGLKVAYYDISLIGGANALANGNCDIFLGFDKSTSERTTSEYLGTYINDAPSLFALSSDGSAVTLTAEELMGKSIAVQDNSTSEVTVSQLFGSTSAVGQTDLASVFTALESGSVDYAASSGIRGKYVVKSAGYTDIVCVCTLSSVPTEIGIGGVSTNTQLNQAVQTALTTISEDGMLNLIIAKWIDSPLDFATSISPADAATAQGEAAEGEETTEGSETDETTESGTSGEESAEGDADSAAATEDATATDEEASEGA